MSLELDKRIKAITDIKSVTDGCHDWEFMTKKGYFANRIVNFTDLSTCAYGEYAGWRVHDQCFLCEQAGDQAYFTYFLPENSLLPEEPEKKYRPFALEEFLKVFDVGDQIEFRCKDNGEVKHAMFIGYSTGFFADTDSSDDKKIPGENDVMIGIYRYSLAYLFENYELFFMGHWQPFGVEEK